MCHSTFEEGRTENGLGGGEELAPSDSLTEEPAELTEEEVRRAE